MIYVIAVYALVAIINLPPLIKNRERKELIAFSVFYVFAFVLSILYANDVNIPSPIKGLQYIIVDVLGIKYPEP